MEQRLLLNEKCNKAAIGGLGGTGKTQVALQFAYSVKERWSEYSIFWIAAQSTESFEQAYEDIASMCLEELINQEQDCKVLVRRYLASPSAGKWLLIVDNADDRDVLFSTPHGSKGLMHYLPQSETGLTLFTTRHLEIAQ